MRFKYVCGMFAAAAMMVSCVGTLAEPVTVQPAPNLAEETPIIDPENPLKIQFVGLYETQMTMSDGTVRSLYQYLPETLGYRQPLVTIAMPSGSDPSAYLESSNWQKIADQYGMTIVLAQAGENGWQEDESEYMEAVFNYMDKRVYYICQDSAFYMVGYGDAANAMMTEVASHADRYAGAAVFDLEHFDTSVLDQMRQTPSAKEGVMQSEVALPVFIGAKERTPEVEALIEYWKQANECEGEPMSNAYANEIYTYPAYKANTNELTYAHVSQVMVSINDQDETREELVQYIYSDYLRRVRRQDSGDIAALRWFATPEELGMDYRTIVVDGKTREFYVYVPTQYRANNETKLPVVFAFHGGGGSGEEFGGRTSWYKVAEERGFIVVFPTGSRKYVDIQANSFTPRSGWSESDTEFFKAMYDYMLENYTVDASRVYTSGQSQGAFMSQYVAAAYPQLLAAASACSVFQDFTKLENRVESTVLPMMWSIGMKDKYGPYSEERNAEITNQMQYWFDRYDIDGTEDKYSYVDGDMVIDEYTTDEGEPLMRFQWVKEKVHANIPDECYAFYDYLCQFSRGEDETLYYMGHPVKME